MTITDSLRATWQKNLLRLIFKSEADIQIQGRPLLLLSFHLLHLSFLNRTDLVSSLIWKSVFLTTIFCHLTQTLCQKLTRVVFYLDSSAHVVTEQSSRTQIKASHPIWIYQQILIWFIWQNEMQTLEDISKIACEFSHAHVSHVQVWGINYFEIKSQSAIKFKHSKLMCKQAA